MRAYVQRTGSTSSASEHGTLQKGPEECSVFKGFDGFHVSLQEGIGPAKFLLLIGDLIRELQCSYVALKRWGTRSSIAAGFYSRVQMITNFMAINPLYNYDIGYRN